jgi:methylglutaconyl-CoA hydratase
MQSTIRIEAPHAGAVRITLARPERGNSFNQTMLNELHEAFGALARDPGVRVLLIAGEGKHFCTGADMGGRGGEGGVGLAEMLSRLDAFPKATIALVRGGCVGGGLAIAAACDVLLAAEDSFFSIPELRVGIAPSPQLSARFMRAMGARAFRRYGLSAERISAPVAYNLGLAHEVLPAGDMDARVARLVDDLLHCAPEATAELKLRIARIEAGEILSEPSRGLDRSEEAREGIAAFKEKRKPRWYPSS